MMPIIRLVRVRALPLLLLAAAVLSTACGGNEPECSLPPLQRPAQDQSLPWTTATFPIIEGELNGAPARLLLDTGYPASVVTQARATDEGSTFTFGGAHSGPWPARVLDQSFANALGVDAVVGADVLGQLGWRMDVRARSTTLLAQPPAGGDPVSTLRPGDCALQSPTALAVEVNLEGRPLRLLLDTGAELTLVRSEHLQALLEDGRAELSGLRLQTGFAGTFTARATRARTLSLGGAEAHNTLVISAAEADAYLGQLSQDYGTHVDGLLGWSFLREFALTFSGANSDSDSGTGTANKALHLARFDTQSHWSREFLGIGILRSASTSPPGIRVDGFLGTSPARDAGLQEGDVITHVNGTPTSGNAPIPGAPGDTLTLQIHREEAAAPLTFQVTYADLLPDPD